MPVEPGARFGPYEVLGQIGSGGMGEVYRARDPRLGRDVAIKLLPPRFADDPERVHRFEREARLLASLNHPHIGAVYGFEQWDGVRLLVLELVPGDTLADRLTHGALGVREGVTLCRQIAEALEEAHAKGVIHRDLKPANIKVTPEGRVKVLDFGLAKALGDEEPQVLEDSPTFTRTGTRDGVVLGTAAYMSPEQARGRVVDKRADIWSFGCVLFEALSGKRPFAGGSTSDTLAAVLTQEPDWTLLPPTTPPLIRSLVRRCLQKDKDRRVHDMADARIEIEEALAVADSGAAGAGLPTHSPRSHRRELLFFLMGGLVVGLGLQLVPRQAPSKRGAPRLNIALPGDSPLQDILGAGRQSLALSSDGNRLVYASRQADGRAQIYLRRMDRVSPEPIAGTTGGELPFLSPDGEWLGFAAEGKLKKVPIGGGEPTLICEAPDPRGASWGDDGTILFAPGSSGGLSRVSASGGAPVPATTPGPAKDGGHRWPVLLPGGRAALFSVQPLSGREEERTINVVRLDTGVQRTLVRGGTYPRYVDGYLLYGQSGSILAAPFDLSRLELTGAAVPVLEDVRMDRNATGRVYVDIAASGSLVYVNGYPRLGARTLVWVDRHGRAEPVTPEKRAFLVARLSPDGQSVATVIQESRDNLWTYDLRRNSWNRLTFEGDVDSPTWTSDGKRVVFNSDQSGSRGIFEVSADGGAKPEELAFRTEWWIDQPSLAPGGQLALVSVQDARGFDLYSLSLDPRHALAPFLATAADESAPVISPSERFVAYCSTESGQLEVYMRSFPKADRKWTISTGGGRGPVWRRDEREIFYQNRNRMVVVPVDASADPPIGSPQVLFETSALGWSNTASRSAAQYDVTANGQRFLMIQSDPREQAPLQIVVIPDFVDEMKARLGAGRK
jgi:Tol biopolymer transport system component